MFFFSILSLIPAKLIQNRLHILKKQNSIAIFSSSRTKIFHHGRSLILMTYILSNCLLIVGKMNVQVYYEEHVVETGFKC